MFVPAYGPGWRHKLPKVSPWYWHLCAIHDMRWKDIRVAPWNRKRLPKRKAPRR